ncbi:MAG: response regulator [Candidatus Rokuibacteriota bacterium]
MKRILVVDDDARLCEVLAEFLARDGYEPVIAHDGRAALDRLRQGDIDLVIADINMPELGGASLVTMLRKDPDWREFSRLPIIVVSALWDVVSFDLEIQGGFAKPVRYEELQPRIRELIGPP